MYVFRDISIKRKLMLITMLTSSLTLVLAGVAYVTYDLVTFRQAMSHDLLTLGQIIGTNSTAALAFDDPRAAAETLAALKAEEHIVAACLYRGDGRLFATYYRDIARSDFSPPEPGEECRRFPGAHLDLRWRIMLDRDVIGTIYLESDLEEFYSRLKRYASIGIVVMVASSLVGWLLAARLQRVISEPVSHLAEIARVVSDKRDYSVRAVKHARDELGLLIDGFNDMLAEIQKRDATLMELSKNLKELYRLSTALQEPLSLKEQLARVLEAARQVVLIDRVYIWMVSPAGDKLAALAGAGFSEEEARDLPGIEIPLVEAGAMAKAYREAVPLVFNERNPLPSELRLQPPFSKLGALRTKNFLVVPMIARGRNVGLLTADNKESDRPILPPTVDLLQTFAAHAAGAVENARLFEELQARTSELARTVGELRALGEVGQAVSSTLDLQTVLTTIVARAVQLSGTDAGAIYEFNETSQEFELRATHGMSEELIEAIRGARIRFGESVVGQAAAKREAVQIAEIQEATDYRLREILGRAGFRALLAVPLLREEKIIGALVVRRRVPGQFQMATVDLLQTFATQSVLAIHNARLFRELEEKSHQLEVASRHKSQFLANMSHELRTPLNAVLGYIELVLDNIFGEVPEQLRDILERARNNGLHLLGLINDVLDLSRIEAGQLTLALSEYSMTDVIQTVVTALGSLASEKKLALKTVVSPDLPPGKGDERRIAQVLLNLVGNAIKFTQIGEVRVEATVSNSAFVVSVSDTGSGISEADQQKIFEEFYQVDSSSTREKGGTGLGLSIAKRIIELQGGRIWVESSVGKGSTFRFTLPVRVDWPTETR